MVGRLMVGAALVVAMSGAALAAETVAGWEAGVDAGSLKIKYPPAVNAIIPVKTFGKVYPCDRPSPYVLVEDTDIRTAAYELWDLTTGRKAGRIQGAKLKDPAFSPEGTYLMGISGPLGRNGACEIWSFKTGQLVRKIEGQGNAELVAAGFAANDRALVIERANFKATLGVWDIKTGTKAFDVELEDWMAKPPAISPGGKLVASVAKGLLKIHDLSEDKTVALAEVPKVQEGNLRVHDTGDAYALVFSPDGSMLAGVFRIFGGAKIVVWDMATGNAAEAGRTGHVNPNQEPVLQWLADGSGWVCGRSIIDRQSGKTVYELPDTGMDDLYRFVVGTHQVVRVSKPQNGRMVAKSFPLPKNEIEKAMQVVRAGGTKIDAGLPPFTKADWSSANEVSAGSDPFKGGLAADAAPKATKKFMTPITLKRPALTGNQVEHQLRGVFFASPSVGQAVVVNALWERMARHRPGAAANRVWVDRIDLASGAAAGTMELPTVADVLDVSLDGTQIVVKLGDDRVDVWTLGGQGKHVVGFRPFEQEENDNKQVRWAKLVDAQHMLVSNDRGRMVLVKIPQCQVVYSVKTTSLTQPAVSAGRKYVAVWTEKGVAVLNAISGESLGIVGTGRGWMGALSFSPDGTKLAGSEAISQSRLVSVWDLSKGGTVAEVLVPRMTQESAMDWVSPGFIMAGGEYLLDLNRCLVAWQYLNPHREEVKMGDLDENYWFVTEEKDRLAYAALPHDAAQKAIAAIKPEDMVLRPGSKVTVEVSTATGDDTVRRQIVDALKKRLESNGCSVAEGQAVRLVARVTTKAGKQIKYNVIGRLQDETANATDYEATLTLEADGKTAWEAKETGTNGEHWVFSKQGETIQAAIDKQIPQFGVQFLTRAPIPKYVPKPKETIGFGSSRLTARGVEAAEAVRTIRR